VNRHSRVGVVAGLVAGVVSGFVLVVLSILVNYPPNAALYVIYIGMGLNVTVGVLFGGLLGWNKQRSITYRIGLRQFIVVFGLCAVVAVLVDVLQGQSPLVFAPDMFAAISWLVTFYALFDKLDQ